MSNYIAIGEVGKKVQIKKEGGREIFNFANNGGTRVLTCAKLYRRHQEKA